MMFAIIFERRKSIDGPGVGCELPWDDVEEIGW